MPRARGSRRVFDQEIGHYPRDIKTQINGWKKFDPFTGTLVNGARSVQRPRFRGASTKSTSTPALPDCLKGSPLRRAVGGLSRMRMRSRRIPRLHHQPDDQVRRRLLLG